MHNALWREMVILSVSHDALMIIHLLCRLLNTSLCTDVIIRQPAMMI